MTSILVTGQGINSDMLIRWAREYFDDDVSVFYGEIGYILEPDRHLVVAENLWGVLDIPGVRRVVVYNMKNVTGMEFSRVELLPGGAMDVVWPSDNAPIPVEVREDVEYFDKILKECKFTLMYI